MGQDTLLVYAQAHPALCDLEALASFFMPEKDLPCKKHLTNQPWTKPRSS